MFLFWHLVFFLTFFSHFVRSDTIESNPSKSTERDDNSGSHQLVYEPNSYPTQSMQNSNGYNSNQNSMSLSESNSAQVYGSGHQTNDQFEQKDRKTLILAIPVKLKMPNSEQDNYEQSVPQSEADSSQIQSQSLLYSKSLPYQSSYSQYSRHPSFMSPNSDDSDPNQPKSSALQPLSHKIYSSPIESQLKSASYSTVNTQKSVSEQPTSLSSNEQKYKNSYETKERKLSPNQYVKDVNSDRENYPIAGEYKGLSLKNEEVDSDYEPVRYNRDPIKSGPTSASYEDSYEARLKQKESAKQVYESVPNHKPEYDYDSNSDEEEEEEDEKKGENYYSHKDYQNNKNGFNLNNMKKEQFHSKPIRPKANVGPQNYHNHQGIGQSLPVFSPEPFDGWPQYYYSKPNLNDWSGISGFQETIDTSLLNLLNGYKIKNPVKDSPRSPMYAPAFDLMGDSQLKAASSPIPMKTMQNSKIYGQAAKYQSIYPPLSLYSGYGQDYGLINLNGDLYPAPLLGQTPPRKQHRPLKQKELMAVEYNPGNRDSIKPHRRNPLLLRPSFMSGLRSATTKPLANYSPFASASTTQSFLSVLPSLPSLQTSFNINTKSIPRQIFPLLYG